MEIWIVSGLVFAGLFAMLALTLWLGAIRHRYWLARREQQRHAEQLEWRDSGRLPLRYETTYAPDEMVDEDMARMLELGYYVADDGVLPSGARHVIYRLPGVPAL